MGDSGSVVMCVREGSREFMCGLVYSDMHTHRVYGMCAGAGVQIQVKCV